MYHLHNQAAGAYGSAFKASVSPRQLEADVLLKAARRLESVRHGWTPERDGELDQALLYNRKLWTLFAAEMADDSNPLPLAIRNNVANIAVFVFKRTFELQAAAQPEKIDALIEINKSIASGLLSNADRTAAVASEGSHAAEPAPVGA